MSKDLKLDLTTHDLYFENSDLVFLEETEYLQQKIKVKLMFFYKEWFLDITKGVDYFNTVFVKNPDLNAIDNMIKITITDIEEVIEILEYQSDYDVAQRKFSLNFKVNTIYGEISYQRELIL